MIKLNCIFFDGEKEVDDASLNFKGKKTPLTRLAIDIVNKVQELDSFINPNFKGEIIFNDIGDLIKPPSEIEIDIVFANKNDEILSYWEAPEGVVGLHCLNSGAFESSDNDFLSTKHRVLVTLDESNLRSVIKTNRENQMYDKDDNSNDELYLKLYMNTITHELAHCLEWIENTNGLPPSEIQNMIESDDIHFNFEEIITGDGILFEKGAYGTGEYLEDVMENRVEEKGMTWLNSIELNNKLVKKLLDVKKKNTLNLRN